MALGNKLLPEPMLTKFFATILASSLGQKQCLWKAIGPSDIADDFAKCLMICSKSSDTLSGHLKTFSWIIELKCLMFFVGFFFSNVWWFAPNHQTYCLMIRKNFSSTLLSEGIKIYISRWNVKILISKHWKLNQNNDLIIKCNKPTYQCFKFKHHQLSRVFIH